MGCPPAGDAQVTPVSTRPAISQVDPSAGIRRRAFRGAAAESPEFAMRRHSGRYNASARASAIGAGVKAFSLRLAIRGKAADLRVRPIQVSSSRISLALHPVYAC